MTSPSAARSPHAPSPEKKKVLVIGSGPAGLGAAIHLLEKAPDEVEVTLVHQGHHLGGRAASYRDANGRVIEHGIHMMFGFYHRLRSLMDRAGIDQAKTLTRIDGMGHIYADWDGKIHELEVGTLAGVIPHVRFDGVRDEDKFDFLGFLANAYVESRSGDIMRHDDVCFRTWAIEQGLDPRLTRYSLFRALRQPYFNYPSSVSAYHVLQAFSLMSSPDDAAVWYVRGGFSELIWDPVGRYLESLGGTIVPYTMVTDWVFSGRKISGVKIARPDSTGHHDGTTSWQSATLPQLADSQDVYQDFDFVISGLPLAVFNKMNASDDRMWGSPYFKRLRNIRSIATLSMTITTKKPVMPGVHGILGLPPPMGNVAEMKDVWDHVKSDPTIGSYLYLSGTDEGFQDWSDETIIRHTVELLSNTAGSGDLTAAGIQHIEFHRNRADFERLVLAEPGVNQFRPRGPKTPFDNLMVAGDWVRNEVDLVVSMEGALLSGQNAADEVLARWQSAA